MSRYISMYVVSILTIASAVIAALSVGDAYGEVDCLMCHEELSKKKVVHAALQMGCATCHSAIDASDVPHKISNKIKRGLSSEAPELCYGCHDKKTFEDKVVHPPVMGGMCLSCHDPHSSNGPKLMKGNAPSLCFSCHDKKKFENKTVHPPVKGGDCLSCHLPHKSGAEKLLQASVPDLCFNCHDKSEFTRKYVHSPVEAGMCLSCHNPHSSRGASLLLKGMTVVCTSCHTAPEIKNGVHIVRAVGKAGHSVSAGEDPKRKGKRFTCASCHQPHSSDFKKLSRYKNDVPFEICMSCHDR